MSDIILLNLLDNPFGYNTIFFLSHDTNLHELIPYGNKEFPSAGREGCQSQYRIRPPFGVPFAIFPILSMHFFHNLHLQDKVYDSFLLSSSFGMVR